MSVWLFRVVCWLAWFCRGVRFHIGIDRKQTHGHTDTQTRTDTHSHGYIKTTTWSAQVRVGVDWFLHQSNGVATQLSSTTQHALPCDTHTYNHTHTYTCTWTSFITNHHNTQTSSFSTQSQQMTMTTTKTSDGTSLSLSKLLYPYRPHQTTHTNTTLILQTISITGRSFLGSSSRPSSSRPPKLPSKSSSR